MIFIDAKICENKHKNAYFFHLGLPSKKKFFPSKTTHEDADAIYKTDISDARWIVYDIPGNIGWMTYLAMLAKMIRDREYGTAAQGIQERR